MTINYILLLIFLLLIGVMLTILPWQNSHTAARPAKFHTANGQFQVVGTKLYTPRGKEFIPKGANIGTWIDNSGIKDVNFVKKIWKFNTVRVLINLKKSEANYGSPKLTDKYVKAYTSAKNGPPVVVIFEAHDFSGSYYTNTTTPSLTDLVNYWTGLANRYKGNPYVWFNVMNEPGACENPVPKQWLTTHETVIKAIRATGAKNTIVLDGHTYGTEDGCNGPAKTPESMSAVLTYGPALISKYSNLVFSFHVYCGWNGGDSAMEDYITRVQAKNLAILVGEFGVVGGDKCSSIEAVNSIYNVLPQRKIGRIVWHYVGWDGNQLVAGENGNYGSTIKPDNGTKPPVGTRPGSLTSLGSKVWDDNK